MERFIVSMCIIQKTQKENNIQISNILQEEKFREKKLLVADIAHKYQFFNKRKTQQILDCGDYLEFALMQNLLTLDKKQKLRSANFCKDRFCPMCNWRRQRNLTGQLKEALESLKNDFNSLEYIFLTLTVKNPKLYDLRATVRHLNKSFQRLKQTKRFKNSILGGLKALEFLGSKTPAGEAHPHFHCLLIVSSSYFKGANYISQDEWIEMWQKALRVDYKPNLDVRRVKPKSKKWTSIDSAIYETIKYSAKHTDLRRMSDEDFQILVQQAKGLRLLSTFGILKDRINTLKIDDDLIDLKEQQEALWVEIARLIYGWSDFDYRLKEVKYSSEEEL